MEAPVPPYINTSDLVSIEYRTKTALFLRGGPKSDALFVLPRFTQKALSPLELQLDDSHPFCDDDGALDR